MSNYYIKYNKYKFKYLALKNQLGGVLLMNEEDYLKCINNDTLKADRKEQINKTLQALDDVFLPNFNVDEDYVGKLLWFTYQAVNLEKYKENELGMVKYILDQLIKLNNATNGLNENGNRLTPQQTIQTKDDITKNLNLNLKLLEQSIKPTYIRALNLFIKDLALNVTLKEKYLKAININDLKNKDNIHQTLQILDDAFLPNFNVDAAYVGDLLWFTYQAVNNAEFKNDKSANDTYKMHTYIITELLKLNQSTPKGLNKDGDRNSKTQQLQKKDTITKNLTSLLTKYNIKALQAFIDDKKLNVNLQDKQK